MIYVDIITKIVQSLRQLIELNILCKLTELFDYKKCVNSKVFIKIPCIIFNEFNSKSSVYLTDGNIFLFD